MRDHGTFLAVFAFLLLQVASQTSNVTTCTPLYEWSLNANNQTPCLVAAFLESVCEGDVEVNAIPPDNHYLGPSLSNANLCQCSTVTYSLISACAGCQNRTFLSWSDWAANCSQVEVGSYLQAIPAQVIVPSWAYLDVTKTDNIFNPFLANESLSSSSPSTASSALLTSITPSTSTTPVTTPSVLPSTPAPRKKSNAGAIAGGVVGGLVGLVAISLAVLFFLRRRTSAFEESEHNPSSFSTSPPPMHEFGSRRTAASPTSISPFPYEPFTKGPSEADTFPGSPVTSAVHTSFDTSSVSTPAVQVLHRYTGSAEV